MSWFSLSVQGKSAWDSHSFVNGLLTGGAAGGFIFKHCIEGSWLHCRMREAAGSAFSAALAPKLILYSPDIAAKILERSIEQEKIYHVAGRLRSHLHKISREDVLAAGKASLNAIRTATYHYLYRENPSAPQLEPNNAVRQSRIKNFVNHILSKYPSDEALALLGLIKERKFKEFARQATIMNLQPTCEKAVESSIVAVTKNVGSKAYDMATRKVISTALVAATYQLFLTTLGWTAENFLASEQLDGLNSSAAYLPSSSHILWASGVYNLVEMGYALWSAAHAKQENIELDKQQVKEIVLKSVKMPLVKKLQQNSLFKTLGVAENQKNLEAIAENLLCEVVDVYWSDLHKTKFLGLPLVL